MIKIEISDISAVNPNELRALGDYFQAIADIREDDKGLPPTHDEPCVQEGMQRLAKKMARGLDDLVAEGLFENDPAGFAEYKKERDAEVAQWVDEDLRAEHIVRKAEQEIKGGLRAEATALFKQPMPIKEIGGGDTPVGPIRYEPVDVEMDGAPLVKGDKKTIGCDKPTGEYQVTKNEGGTAELTRMPSPPRLVDSAGEEWDPKKHTRTQSKYADGRWKPIRTNTPKVIDTPAPAPALDVPSTFEGLMNYVNTQIANRKLKPEQVFHTVQQYGFNSLIDLREDSGTVPKVLAALQAVVIGGE